MSFINILKTAKKLKQEIYMSKDELQSRQEEKFRKLLKHAYKNSLFYRNYYTEHGIKEKDLEEINIKDLPVMNKNILMDNFNELVCDKKLNKSKLEEYLKNLKNIGKTYLNKYLVIHTSGSGGKIGIFIYSKKELDVISSWRFAMGAFSARSGLSGKSKRPKKLRLSYIGAVEGNFAGISSLNYFYGRGISRMFVSFLPISINLPMNEMVKKLNHFQPHILNGYSSGIYLLALEQLAGNLNIHPVRLTGSADHLTEEMRSIIQKAFNIDPGNYYSTAESILGVQRNLDTDMILFNNLNIFEIVNEKMNDVAEGEIGKLILTPLYKYTQPLIRYEINDNLLLSSKGDDKSGFQRIKKIVGRNEEILWFKGNNNEKLFLHPLALVDFFVPGLGKMQFIQTDKASLLMKAVINNNKKDVITNIQKKMSEILKINQLDDIVKFKIEVVDHISNDHRTGKYRLVIPFTKK
ncbi:MAG: hypothetical protein PVH61_40075 [Candidatus Aminicenantes bacterium]|jgi:phenylacetate-CoA ligase